MSAWIKLKASQRKREPWPIGKYTLTERAEIPRHPGAMRLLQEKGTEILYDGMPGPHMEPLDPQAEANIRYVIEHYGARPLDPTSTLSLVMGEVDDAASSILMLEAQIVALRAKQKGEIAAGNPGRPGAPPRVEGYVHPVIPQDMGLTAPTPVPGQGGVRVEAPPGYMIPKPPPIEYVRSLGQQRG